MTNSFFQTWMHPDNVPLTAVNMPCLYKWLVMPMGIKNTLAVHQQHVSAALQQFIGKICHMYLINIIIWSNSIEEHAQNVCTILQALEDAKLYCNPNKTKLFCMEINFLGHQISCRGIKADKSKVDRIRNWPTPHSANDVRSFLRLIRYLAVFLPNLAKFSAVLDELTKKEYDKQFPGWTTCQQTTFNEIKRLVMSMDCLTMIDPKLMPENKIFVMTNTSDTGSGTIHSIGPSYELARPVVYDSHSFKKAELNYPVHEKKCWQLLELWQNGELIS